MTAGNVNKIHALAQSCKVQVEFGPCQIFPAIFRIEQTKKAKRFLNELLEKRAVLLTRVEETDNFGRRR